MAGNTKKELHFEANLKVNKMEVDLCTWGNRFVQQQTIYDG
jgi:hypothetical protein